MKGIKYLLLALVGSPFLGTDTATAQEKPSSPAFTPWKTIAEKDIVWRRREWKEIDASQKGNEVFKFSKNNPEVPSLADQLITGVLSGNLTAYSATNDRFTTTLTSQELEEFVRSSGVKAFKKYQIKEDSLSVGADGHLEVRILGLAPIGLVKDEKGKLVERPLFWIYYPDSREFLSKSVALKKDGSTTNWDAIFEGRQFKGRVTKSNDRQYGSLVKR